MIAVDLLSEIFILIVLGIYLKRNNVIDGHTVDQLTDLIVKIWYTHIQFWDMKNMELSVYIWYYIFRWIFLWENWIIKWQLLQEEMLA